MISSVLRIIIPRNRKQAPQSEGFQMLHVLQLGTLGECTLPPGAC